MYASRKRCSAFHRVGRHPGGSGSLTTRAPMSPAGTGVHESSTACTSIPGAAFAGDPSLTGSFSIPMQFAQIDQPVSVCHQWSMTGTPSLASAHRSVSGSSRSPARKRVLNRLKS